MDQATFQYAEKVLVAKVLVLSPQRWRQYIQSHFPGLRLSQSKEDVCDLCVRIDTQLLSPNISEDMQAQLLLEKSTHIYVVVGQRRAMAKFIKFFVSKLDPRKVLRT